MPRQTPVPPVRPTPGGCKTLALTGATGFIGQHLIRVFLEQGLEIRALVRPSSLARARNAWPKGGIDWITGDITDAAALDRLVTGAQVVVHCAGTVRGGNRDHFFKTNALGSKSVAEAAGRAGVDHFLLVSSLAARHPELSYYAASKKRSEELVEDYASKIGMSVGIVRPPAVYGPGDKEIAPLFTLMEKGFLFVPASVSNRFSLIHVHDLAAMIAAAALEGWSGICEPDDGHVKGYDWCEVARIHQEVFGKSVRLVVIPRWLLSGAGFLSLILTRPLGRHPMLTPWKVRELCHPDWVCRPETRCKLPGWRPTITLKFALENGLIGK